jgi:O-antigen/teichoic acid export membrane protein
VSNLVNPVLITVDRFALGALVSAAAAGYYAAAYEVATKMWIVTGALCPVLFPAIAATARTQPARAGTLVARGARVLVVVLFPAALAMVMAGRTVLATWVSPAFAEFGARSLSLLAIGIFINGVGQAAFTALQAAGRARVTAFAHVAQLLPFIAALWLVAPRFGASGVAAVTLVRLAVDAAVMWVVAARALPDARPGLVGAAAYTVGAVAALAVGALAEARLPGWGRAAYAGVGVAVHLAVSWRFLLPHGERATARLAVLRAAGPRRFDAGTRAA